MEVSTGFVGSLAARSGVPKTSVCSGFMGRPLVVASDVRVGEGVVVRGRGSVQMNLFERFFRVVRANTNKAVSDMEDPEKILKQVVEEMERDLGKVRAGYSETKASLKRAEADKAKAAEAVQSWLKRAELALKEENDDLAREALTMKSQQESKLEKLTRDVAEFEKVTDNLYNSMITYQKKIEEAKNEAQQFTSRAAAAKALKTVNEMSSGVGDSSAAMFGKMKDKIEAMEINAEVQAESLPAAENPELESKFRALESDNVDDELDKMKRRLVKGKD